jgi:hypothetical protein
MTLHLTQSTRLWSFQLLGFEVQITKKNHFNRFYRDTQGAIFERLKMYVFIKICLLIHSLPLFKKNIVRHFLLHLEVRA